MTDQAIGRHDADAGWPELLAKQQAAECLQVSSPAINNYLRRGILRAYELPGGRLVRIKRVDLLQEVPR